MGHVVHQFNKRLRDEAGAPRTTAASRAAMIVPAKSQRPFGGRGVRMGVGGRWVMACVCVRCRLALGLCCAKLGCLGEGATQVGCFG